MLLCGACAAVTGGSFYGLTVAAPCDWGCTTSCILFETDEVMSIRRKRRVSCPNETFWGPGNVEVRSMVDGSLGGGVRHEFECLRSVWQDAAGCNGFQHRITIISFIPERGAMGRLRCVRAS